MLSWESQRDLFYARKMNQDKDTVIFDFTRSVPKFVDLNETLSAVEQIKNGAIFASKWESDSFLTDPPHVICFSNYLPQEPGAISFDRWKLCRLGNKTKQLIPMCETQANDFIIDHVHFETQLNEILGKNKNKKKIKKKFNKTSIKPAYLSQDEWWDQLAEIEIKKMEFGSTHQSMPDFNQSIRYKGLFQSSNKTLIYSPGAHLLKKCGD